MRRFWRRFWRSPRCHSQSPGRGAADCTHRPRSCRRPTQKIDREGARILALRFMQDPMCPKERFERLRSEFGAAFEAIEIDARYANPRGPKPAHSVLTNHLIDEAGQPTREALDRTLAFLGEQLKPAAP